MVIEDLMLREEESVQSPRVYEHLADWLAFEEVIIYLLNAGGPLVAERVEGSLPDEPVALS